MGIAISELSNPNEPVIRRGDSFPLFPGQEKFSGARATIVEIVPPEKDTKGAIKLSIQNLKPNDVYQYKRLEDQGEHGEVLFEAKIEDVVESLRLNSEQPQE